MYKITGGNALLDVNLVLTKANVGDSMKVADLGCGSSGHFIFPTAHLVGHDGVVYAVDIMKIALENIERRRKQENLSNVKTVWSNLEIFNATRIESGSLDIALLVNTLYQSHKRKEIIREAVRMLKKGGKLVIIDWKNTSSPFGPPAEERVDLNALKEGAGHFGLNIEEEFFAGHYHYGLIFTKL